MTEPDRWAASSGGGRLLELRAIEAVVMIAEDPVPPDLLAQLLEVSTARVIELCQLLADEYDADGRGFILAKVAGGYRFQSHPDLSAHVERFVLDGHVAKMSPAALETLAIVAYKQPASRGQIAAIRGVNVDGVLRTLVARDYVCEVGRDPGPGQAVLFGTTRQFLESLGLDSLEDLPPLGDFVPPASVVEAFERGLLDDREAAATYFAPASAFDTGDTGDTGDADDTGPANDPRA